MKRIILLAISIILFTSVSYAAPFLVCDPQAGITSYKFTPVPPAVSLPAWIPTMVVAQADGSLRWDVATSTVGTTEMNIQACKNGGLWCSSTVPFVLIRPVSATVPANTRLSP
jgi:hypothetical protein